MSEKPLEPPDYWRPKAATILFGSDVTFRDWVVQWDRDKEIPFPLPDWLTERAEDDKGLLGPARCCQWAFACQGYAYNFFRGTADQAHNGYDLAGKFPAHSVEVEGDHKSGWWWRVLEDPLEDDVDYKSRSHWAPPILTAERFSPYLPTRVGALLWLMDNWNPEYDFTKYVAILKRHSDAEAVSIKAPEEGA